MPNQLYIREVTFLKDRSRVEAGKCCAYNQTRQRFLSADVEVADFTATVLDSRLAMLMPGCCSALWIVPFRGISATSVRSPVDLLYLNQDCVVLHAVESFPLAMIPPSSAQAASVVALPADTIARAGVFPGDQLILCDPEEMKVRLRQLPISGVDTQLDQREGHSPPEGRAGGMVGRVLPWIHRSPSKPADENYPGGVVPIEEAQSPEPTTKPELDLEKPEPRARNKKAAKNWLQRLLSPDPPEPRKAARESLPRLAAYFFTGAAPVGQTIRDISATGMYLVTDERWYPGTIIRMTLTDRKNPTAEYSVTVNAMVVRWGNDGVGLQFVFEDQDKNAIAG